MEGLPKKESESEAFGRIFGGLSSYGETKQAAEDLREVLGKARLMTRDGELRGVILSELPVEEKNKIFALFLVMGIFPWVEEVEGSKVRFFIEHKRDFQKLNFFKLLEKNTNVHAEVAVERTEPVIPDPYAFPLETIEGKTAVRQRTASQEKKAEPEEIEEEVLPIDDFLYRAIERFDEGIDDEDEPEIKPEHTQYASLKQFPQKYFWDGKGFKNKDGYISFKEYREIVLKAKDDPKAMAMAVEMGTGLVKSVLDRVVDRFGTDHQVTADDLFQEGMKGLVRALQKIEGREDTRPSSYLVPYIEGYMRSALKERHYNGLNVEHSLKEGRAKFLRTREALLADPQNKYITSAELVYKIAEEAQMPLDYTRAIARSVSVTQEEFIEDDISPEDAGIYEPWIGKNTPEHQDLKRVFEGQLDKLEPRSELILRLYYGLIGGDKWHDVQSVKKMLSKKPGETAIDPARLERLTTFDPSKDALDDFNNAEKIFLVLMGKLPAEVAEGLQKGASEDTPSIVTLEDIGEIFNLSRDRISQIVAKASRKFRHPGVSSELVKAGYLKHDYKRYTDRNRNIIEVKGIMIDE